MNYKVKFIRCDNAGENQTAEALCKQEGLGIIFEYTAPNTPQQNGRVERRFATLYGQVRSMLNGAHLNQEFRNGLWAECARTATDLDNLDCENLDHKPRYTLFYGKEYKPFKYLHQFGEIAIVTTGAEIQSKINNRGLECIYLGHASGHSSEVSRFLKISTKQVVKSRDVKWLDRTFLEYQKEQGQDMESDCE